MWSILHRHDDLLGNGCYLGLSLPLGTCLMFHSIACYRTYNQTATRGPFSNRPTQVLPSLQEPLVNRVNVNSVYIVDAGRKHSNGRCASAHRLRGPCSLHAFTSPYGSANIGKLILSGRPRGDAETRGSTHCRPYTRGAVLN